MLVQKRRSFLFTYKNEAEKGEREKKKGKDRKKDAKETRIGSLRNRELPPTTTAYCQSD
jgi:hypothetical protein